MTIPDSVGNIGQEAFKKCVFDEVVLGKGIKKIGSNAFCDCTDLLSVSMGASLKQIDSYAFYNCTWLKDVYITDLGGWCSIVFNDEYSNPLAYANNLYLNNNILNNLVIPDGVTNVSKYAFYGCDSMVSVFIPSCVESIGNSSFDYCSNLEVVTIQDGLTVIPNGAFKYSSKISRITIPVTVKSMELYAFYQGDSIDIFYEGSAKQWNEIKINSYDGSNRCIIQGKHYYYSETEPTTEGNFWHYVNGEIVVWFA